VWTGIGAAGALGLVSLGPLALVPAVIAALLMLSRRRLRGSAFGVLSGAGLLLLFVAWVQRHGPGTTCWHTAMGSGCDQHLNPIPWLICGLAFLIAGIAAHRNRASQLPTQ
jgi:hypothetical protein